MFHQSGLVPNWLIISLITLLTCRYIQTQDADYDNGVDERCKTLYDPNRSVSFDFECNRCFCMSFGVAACTRKVCSRGDRGNKTDKANNGPDPRCLSGKTYFKSGCNSCFCVSNPLVVACTKMYCPKAPNSSPVRAIPPKIDCKKDPHPSH
nr:PREDICTED: uncharacterized protein LOC109043348 [Bemisia tabaci]